MTFPRQILPGRTYLISRRCTQRQFLLRPDDRTNQIILYCLAEAVRRFGIEIITWMAMSNHYHAVVCDPFGVLPRFLRHLNQMIAKALNVRWSRAENLWTVEQPCVTWLLEDDDVLGKSIYTLVNPVADHLVERVADWPGSSSWSAHVHDKPLIIKRPSAFFRKDGAMPEEVVLTAVAPRLTAEPDRRWDLTAWREKLCSAVHAAEEAAHKERTERGLSLLGRRAVRDQSPFASPTTSAARGGLKPTVACRDGEVRRVALAALRLFRQLHYGARQRFLAGERDVIFPDGTWALRPFCAAPS